MLSPMASRSLPKKLRQDRQVSLSVWWEEIKSHNMTCNKNRNMIICYHEVKCANNDSDIIGTHSSLTQFTPLLEGRFDWPNEKEERDLQ